MSYCSRCLHGHRIEGNCGWCNCEIDLSRPTEFLSLEVKHLTDQLATAREALKKYSDQKNWGCSNCYDSAVNCGPPHAQDVWIRGDEAGPDIGDEALAAIKELEK